MPAKDAEMPPHYPLEDEIKEIAKRLAALRQDIEGLSEAVARAGGHQAERAEDAVKEALAAVETSVQRNPLSALGIALGIGFLFGVILRR